MLLDVVGVPPRAVTTRLLSSAGHSGFTNNASVPDSLANRNPGQDDRGFCPTAFRDVGKYIMSVGRQDRCHTILPRLF
jgi:hypothetical protein